MAPFSAQEQSGPNMAHGAMNGMAAPQSRMEMGSMDMGHRDMGPKEMGHGEMHAHGSAVPVSYADLTRTAALLEAARRATEKYKDVRVAEADGYHQIGPDVPGMGMHFVGSRDGSAFDVEHPSILLYEKDASAPEGHALVGVSYLLNAPEGPERPAFTSAFSQNACQLAQAFEPLRAAGPQRKNKFAGGSVRIPGRTLHRGNRVDGPRLDLERQSQRSFQPYESHGSVAMSFRSARGPRPNSVPARRRLAASRGSGEFTAAKKQIAPCR